MKKILFIICCLVIVFCGYIFLFGKTGPRAIRSTKVTDPVLLPVVTAFADAIDAAPNAPKPRMELGMTYEGAGMDELAEATYKQYTDIFPARIIGWYRLAVVQQKQGKIKEAIASLERGVAVAPEQMDAPHWQLAFWYIDLGELAKATAHIAVAQTKKPNSMQVKIAKGRIALAQGKPLEAIAILDDNRLISAIPDGYVYQLLGRAYRALGDEEKSREAWSRAGQKRPNWADPWTHIVVEHVVGLNAMRQEIMRMLRNNNVQQARMLIDDYFSYDRDNRVIRRLDAKCNTLEGKLGNSLKKYERLIREDSKDKASMILLAKLRMQITQFQTQEEIEVTKALLESVLIISPDHVQAKILLDTLPKE
jgi:tetratricopeptide (TPR) repeat protein